MKRARTPTHKHDRRQGLLAAARRRLAEAAFDAVQLSQIAQEVGLSKASIFTYYRSKESLFLAVLSQELDAWFDYLDANLPRQTSVPAVASLLADSLMARPVLRHLLAILHTVLEANSTEDQLRQFKGFLLERTTHTGAKLAQVLGLPPQQGIELFVQLDALVIGMQHVGNPTPGVAAVLADTASLAPFQIDLAQALPRAIRALLLGAQRNPTF